MSACGPAGRRLCGSDIPSGRGGAGIFSGKGGCGTADDSDGLWGRAAFPAVDAVVSGGFLWPGGLCNGAGHGSWRRSHGKRDFLHQCRRRRPADGCSGSLCGALCCVPCLGGEACRGRSDAGDAGLGEKMCAFDGALRHRKYLAGSCYRPANACGGGVLFKGAVSVRPAPNAAHDHAALTDGTDGKAGGRAHPVPARSVSGGGCDGRDAVGCAAGLGRSGRKAV